MPRSIRSKLCDRCNQAAPVLYRVQYDQSGEWIFVCRECWTALSQDSSFYVYGGTWKAQKKH